MSAFLLNAWREARRRGLVEGDEPPAWIGAQDNGVAALSAPMLNIERVPDANMEDVRALMDQGQAADDEREIRRLQEQAVPRIRNPINYLVDPIAKGASRLVVDRDAFARDLGGHFSDIVQGTQELANLGASTVEERAKPSLQRIEDEERNPFVRDLRRGAARIGAAGEAVGDWVAKDPWGAAVDASTFIVEGVAGPWINYMRDSDAVIRADAELDFARRDAIRRGQNAYVVGDSPEGAQARKDAAGNQFWGMASLPLVSMAKGAGAPARAVPRVPSEPVATLSRGAGPAIGALDAGAPAITMPAPRPGNAPKGSPDDFGIGADGSRGPFNRRAERLSAPERRQVYAGGKKEEPFSDPRLSPSENKAVEMARNGYSNTAIADEMYIDDVGVFLSKAREKAPDIRIPDGWARADTQINIISAGIKAGKSREKILAEVNGWRSTRNMEPLSQQNFTVQMSKARKDIGARPDRLPLRERVSREQVGALLDEGLTDVQAANRLAIKPHSFTKLRKEWFPDRAANTTPSAPHPWRRSQVNRSGNPLPKHDADERARIIAHASETGGSIRQVASDLNVSIGKVQRALASKPPSSNVLPLAATAGAGGALGWWLMDEANAQEGEDPYAQDGGFEYPDLPQNQTGRTLATGQPLLEFPKGYDYSAFKPTSVPRETVLLNDGTRGVRISVEAPDGRQMGIVYGPNAEFFGVAEIGGPPFPARVDPYPQWGPTVAHSPMVRISTPDPDSISALRDPQRNADRMRPLVRVEDGIPILAGMAAGRVIGPKIARLALGGDEAAMMISRMVGPGFGGAAAGNLAPPEGMSPGQGAALGSVLGLSAGGTETAGRYAHLRNLADQINAAEGPAARQNAIVAVGQQGGGVNVRALDRAGAFPAGIKIGALDVPRMVEEFSDSIRQRPRGQPLRATRSIPGVGDEVPPGYLPPADLPQYPVALQQGNTANIDLFRAPDGSWVPSQRNIDIADAFDSTGWSIAPGERAPGTVIPPIPRIRSPLDNKVGLMLDEREFGRRGTIERIDPEVATRVRMALRPRKPRGESPVPLPIDEGAASRTASALEAEITAEVEARLAQMRADLDQGVPPVKGRKGIEERTESGAVTQLTGKSKGGVQRFSDVELAAVARYVGVEPVMGRGGKLNRAATARKIAALLQERPKLGRVLREEFPTLPLSVLVAAGAGALSAPDDSAAIPRLP